MKIPSKKEKLFRKYEGVIFYSDEHPKSDRIYSFYLLLRPMLGWLKQKLRLLGLENAEIESELYLIAHSVFAGFNTEKSSIIPYLRKQLPWKIAKSLELIKKKQDPLPLTDISGDPDSYYLNEEFYWRIPGISLEDRYVGKCFTRAELYVIYMILVSDDKELSTRKLAEAVRVDKRRMKEMLLDLGTQLNWRKSHG